MTSYGEIDPVVARMAAKAYTEVRELIEEAVQMERARLREAVLPIVTVVGLMADSADDDPLALVKVSQEAFRDTVVRPLAAALALLPETP